MRTGDRDGFPSCVYMFFCLCVHKCGCGASALTDIFGGLEVNTMCVLSIFFNLFCWDDISHRTSLTNLARLADWQGERIHPLPGAEAVIIPLSMVFTRVLLCI